MAGDVIAVARRFRKQARQRGNPARVQLTKRYARAVAGIRRDAAKIERQVAQMRRNGIEPTADVLRALESVRALRVKAERDLLAAADSVMPLVDEGTRREVIGSLKDSRELLKLGKRNAADLDDTAVLNLVANVEQGPLREVLARRAGADADAVAQLLVDGMVRERDPAKTAALITERIEGSSLASALRLVRTETHRARREAARLLYIHTDGVEGWIWVCSLTPTSCGLCWARHGHVYPLDVPMATHPNCSCELVPWFGQTDILTGPELFTALTDSEQDTALGAATARAYRAGAITLDDLVSQRRDPQWGPVGSQASLLSVLGADARNFY